MLSAAAVQLYLYVVGRSSWTVDGASGDLNIRTADIVRARDELHERQLLTAVANGGENLVANAPDVALAALVDGDERTIQDLRTRVAHHRSELMALAPAYREALAPTADSAHIEVVEDPETIQRLLIDIGRRVTKEALIAQPGAGYSVELHEESNAKDRVLALVSRNEYEGDEAALVVRDENLVRTLATVFDTAWELATPFRTGRDGDADGVEHELTAVQSAVLSGLAGGLTDEVIASRLDISVRTCRRHIAALFEKLGAESRFQAGALAVQRGWITPRGVRP